jgi:hypothetical protein
MRIIASMTTIPSRIDHIRPAIESVIAQTVPIEDLELNIPYVCVRTNEQYVLPTWLEEMNRVKIFRTDDYGSITKVAPTFLRHKNDEQTYIWSADDDFAYPTDQLEKLFRYHRPSKYRILARHGGQFKEDGSIDFMFGEAEVSMFEGFGTVLYPPSCIGEDFLEYVQRTSENMDCRKSDDVVLSHYFSSRRIPIYLCNIPSQSEPFYPTGAITFSDDRNALVSETGEHRERYARVHRYLNSLSPTAVRPTR